jgi:hypothetical protein
MKHFFCILAFVLTLCMGEAASRKVLQIDVSTNPSDGDTLVINGSTRTWKTSVVTASTQIEIAATAALSKEKLFQHVAANPFSGPLILQSVDADSIKLTAQVDGSLTYSASGSWETFALSTLTVTSAYNVRMPITVEPAATRITIANDLVTALGLATGAFGTTDAHMANFPSLTGSQTVTSKTLQTGYIDSLTIRNGSTDDNTSIETTAYQGIHFWDWNNQDRVYSIRPNNNGYPSVFYTYASVTSNTAVAASDNTLSNNTDALLNVASADNRYLRLGAANTATDDLTVSGDVEFQGETYIVNGQGGTLTDVTIATATSIGGTIGSLTGGSIAGTAIAGSTFTAASTFNNSGHLYFQKLDVTSIGSGDARLDPSNATFVRISSTTGNYTLTGISGGADGRMIWVYNSGAYSLTVSEEDSAETTAANRIIIPGSDTTKASSASYPKGVAQFIYDSSESRWILLNWQN